MRVPRFRFTLGQLIKLIAVLAIFFALLRTPAWPLILAIVPIILGFAIDRSRGGPGVYGAMLAGAIGFAGFGAGLSIVLLIFGGSGHLGLAEFAVMVFALGLVGWGIGVIIGCWMAMIIRELDRAIHPRSSNDEPLGQVAGRGLLDRRRRLLRAGGHHE